MQRSLSGRVRHGYAIGGLATGSYGTVPGLLLLPYLTDVLGVGGAVAGLIIFVPKAWDFFANPMAGRISDRSHHPGGRRRTFIIRGDDQRRGDQRRPGQRLVVEQHAQHHRQHSLRSGCCWRSSPQQRRTPSSKCRSWR